MVALSLAPLKLKTWLRCVPVVLDLPPRPLLFRPPCLLHLPPDVGVLVAVVVPTPGLLSTLGGVIAADVTGNALGEGIFFKNKLYPYKLWGWATMACFPKLNFLCTRLQSGTILLTETEGNKRNL